MGGATLKSVSIGWAVYVMLGHLTGVARSLLICLQSKGLTPRNNGLAAWLMAFIKVMSRIADILMPDVISKKFFDFVHEKKKDETKDTNI